MHHTELGFVLGYFLMVTLVKPQIERCGSDNCKLPDCFCAGRGGPFNGDASVIPQMVLMTFDDAVNSQVYDSLMDLFGSQSNRTNPNGCPIGMTLFVSHIYTDYCMVADFWKQGHEVASHSITHKLPIKYWARPPYSELDIEIDGQKEMMSKLAGIPSDDIRGFRSPYIQPGGDTQFKILRDRSFFYDSSLLVYTQEGLDPYWPYTLDFPFQLPCLIEPCPFEGYPGIWELPIQPVIDQTGKACTFLDRCEEDPQSVEDIYSYLMENFNRSYNTNRAPYIINMHAYWFESNNFSLPAFRMFLDDLTKRQDVWIITSYQLVQWMKNPTRLASIDSFEPWRCAGKRVLEGTCTTRVMEPGKNRTKKMDYEIYRSKQPRRSSPLSVPQDGGRGYIVITVLLFGLAYIYILRKEYLNEN